MPVFDDFTILQLHGHQLIFKLMILTTDFLGYQEIAIAIIDMRGDC